ncbi:tetratricopeptide repeat protein [Saccharothrix tamanrassetensis]|nr:tetratricopeptide repeat protein [Saccharothrix tamanrassetensis]
MDSLGFIAHHSGRPTDAVDYYRRALDLQRRRLDSFEEADTLDRMARAHVALGEVRRAREVWRQAVELYRAQHRTQDVERVLRGLDDLAADR